MVTGFPDYLLQMYSPCIDAGHPDILDADGTRSDIGYAGGPGGFSYNYVDLPPQFPDSLWADIVEDTIIIEWDYATETDFNHYNIYRSNESGFSPSIENLIGETDTSLYYDIDWDSTENLYYLVTSVDNQDNESDPSPELGVILTSVFGDDEPFIPYKIELSQNYPNPFNPRTTIKYTIPDLGPQPAQVELVVFNILGEKVKSLVNTRQGVGTYTVIWDGSDDNGNDVSSGVYFYQLKVWGFPIGKVKKMVLVR
ncbi:MAG: T9SS type A sorting domain-containing protein [candidate division Zixibacteria bacterium]|nr:T9SS type A sorting domain-containing protein [candidate division Zixibacteria bacterium]